MSKYTAELRTIIDNNFDIFDFTYTRSSESQAIVSNEKLQQGFIDHYYLDMAFADIIEERLQAGAFHCPPANTSIRIGFNVFPAIERLRENIGLTGFFLVLKGIKLHI